MTLQKPASCLLALCLFALAGAASAQAGPDELKARVGAYVQPSNAERTRVAMEQLTAAGFAPTVETFEGGGRNSGPLEGRNIVVLIPGTGGGGRAGGEILLTAHYDAVKLRDGTMAHGVVDNAGSVVAVIETARALKLDPPVHDVRLVLFDQEELGLIGARQWIEKNGTSRIVGVVNSDVAAYGDTLMYGQNNGPASAWVTRTVREVCAARDLSCVGYPVYPPSDDRAFSAAGVPVVSLGFQDHVGAHQMWLAFNGGETTGLAEGFVPRVFRTIHSAEDRLEVVEGNTLRLAADTYEAVIRAMDVRLVALQDQAAARP